MKKGFTLVEIMIVVAIIGLLAAIAIPSFMRARTRSQQNACINNLRQLQSGKEQCGMELGLTNLAVITWSQIIGAEAFVKSFPLCPASTTDAPSEAQSEFNYNLLMLGSNSLCRIQPAGSFAHALPAQE